MVRHFGSVKSVLLPAESLWVFAFLASHILLHAVKHDYVDQGPNYKIYSTIYHKFITGSSYDTNLQRAKIYLRSVVS